MWCFSMSFYQKPHVLKWAQLDKTQKSLPDTHMYIIYVLSQTLNRIWIIMDSHTYHPVPTGGDVNQPENILFDNEKPANPSLQSAELFRAVNNESSAWPCQIT